MRTINYSKDTLLVKNTGKIEQIMCMLLLVSLKLAAVHKLRSAGYCWRLYTFKRNWKTYQLNVTINCLRGTVSMFIWRHLTFNSYFPTAAFKQKAGIRPNALLRRALKWPQKIWPRSCHTDSEVRCAVALTRPSDLGGRGTVGLSVCLSCPPLARHDVASCGVSSMHVKDPALERVSLACDSYRLRRKRDSSGTKIQKCLWENKVVHYSVNVWTLIAIHTHTRVHTSSAMCLPWSFTLYNGLRWCDTARCPTKYTQKSSSNSSGNRFLELNFPPK